MSQSLLFIEETVQKSGRTDTGLTDAGFQASPTQNALRANTRSRWLVRDNHKSPLPKKNFLFLEPLESAERFRCIFPIKYTHRADRRKKSEGIPAHDDGDQFGESWRLGQILGSITPKRWSWSSENVNKFTEIIV